MLPAAFATAGRVLSGVFALGFVPPPALCVGCIRLQLCTGCLSAQFAVTQPAPLEPLASRERLFAVPPDRAPASAKDLRERAYGMTLEPEMADLSGLLVASAKPAQFFHGGPAAQAVHADLLDVE